MSRTLRLLAPLFALSLVLGACQAGDTNEDGGASPGPGGEGGEITVTSLWGGSEQAAFRDVLDQFERESGVTVIYESQRTNYAESLRTNPPDVAIIPGIGFLRSFAGAGEIVPLSELGINAEDIEGNYPAGSLEIGTVNDELYALMVKLNSKSTMWYRPDVFSELGVEPPETWEDFESLVGEIRDAGQTPMALGAADSWTLTDWFESIYLRQAGPDAYNQLFSAEGDWTDPSVQEAIDTMLSVLTEENVVGGVDTALATGFVDAIGLVFGAEPEAPLYYEGGFVGGIATQQVNPELAIGETIDFFDFPAIGEDTGAITIGGDVIAAFSDNPGVAELITYLTTTEAGETWAGTGAIVSPLTGVDTGVYPNELAQREAEQVANASSVHFDGSDLLPAGTDLGALLQSALRGEDAGPLLEDFQSQVQGAWEAEQGG